MRLTEIIRKIAKCRERSKKLGNDKGWANLRTRQSLDNQIASYAHELQNFGSGLPIFEIHSIARGSKFREYYQAETKEEAVAAWELHNAMSVAEITEVIEIKLRTLY